MNAVPWADRHSNKAGRGGSEAGEGRWGRLGMIKERGEGFDFAGQARAHGRKSRPWAGQGGSCQSASCIGAGQGRLRH